MTDTTVQFPTSSIPARQTHADLICLACDRTTKNQRGKLENTVLTMKLVLNTLQEKEQHYLASNVTFDSPQSRLISTAVPRNKHEANLATSPSLFFVWGENYCLLSPWTPKARTKPDFLFPIPDETCPQALPYHANREKVKLHEPHQSSIEKFRAHLIKPSRLYMHRKGSIQLKRQISNMTLHV
jgi:hypothetical protein